MARDSYGAGSLRETAPGSGVWKLRVYLGTDPVSGRPRQRQQTFHGTEKAARKALAVLVTEAQRQKVTTGSTVGTMLDAWLDFIEPNRRPKTMHEYRRKVERDIKPALGDVALDKLTARQLDTVYTAGLQRGLSTSTVTHWHRIIHAALRQAERWGWVDRNVARQATPPGMAKTEMTVPTPERLRQLVVACQTTEPVLASAIALAALTGMRRGELCALRWSDVDLVAGTVTVSRALTVVGGEHQVGPTKTHANRRVALDDVAVRALQLRGAQQRQLADKAGVDLVADPFVLSYRADGGQPASPSTFTGRFHKLCERMADETGEPWPYRFHDLRHFSVTTLIAAGVDIRTVAERHGHAQATMTLNRYAHALPEQDRAAADILGRVLDPPKELGA